MRIRALFFFILVVLAALAGGAWLLFEDRDPPQLSLEPLTVYVSPTLAMEVQAADAKSGIRHLQVLVSAGNQTYTVLDVRYTDKPREVRESFTLESLSLADGDIRITAGARDKSFAQFGQGNAQSISRQLIMDTVQPTVEAVSQQHTVRTGGPAVVTYTVSETPSTTGVQVGEFFFPGYLQGNNTYASFFTWPWNMNATQFQPELFAEDAAGNRGTAPFNVGRIERSFPEDTINLSDSVLQKIDGEFTDQIPGQLSTVERYLEANRNVRQANADALLKLGRMTTPLPKWAGEFESMRGAHMAGFGDRRTYVYNGQAIDQQTHLGQDIANVAKSKVPAGNAGLVVFAGYLGIYGNMVLLDHGVGLQSMYAHLSEISVQEGDTVSKGQIIGRTGVSGMAVGDHLHYGMYVSGVPVAPIEFWDRNWIRNNIEDRLALPAAPKE